MLFYIVVYNLLHLGSEMILC